MDMHLFRVFAREAQRLLEGCRIEKIQDIGPRILLLSLFGGGKKRQLCLRMGRRDPFCFFSDARITAARKPQATTMRLRKHFAGRRVASAVFRPAARQIWLMGADGGMKGKSCWLNLDLANGPEIHFLNPGEHPEAENLAWPAASELACALADWRVWPVLTPPLRKTLQAMSLPDQLALMADLQDGAGDLYLYMSSGAGCARHVEKLSPWPLPKAWTAGLTEIPREDVLAALEESGQALVLEPLHAQAAADALSAARRRIRSLEKLQEKLNQDEERLETMQKRGCAARTIKANLWRLNSAEHVEEITLEDQNGQPLHISLDKRLSLLENMNRFFHAAQRGARGLKLLAGRRQALEEELRQIKEAPESAGSGFKEGAEKVLTRMPSGSKDVERFTSSAGYGILRGKSAKGNEKVRKLAAGHDLWAHVLHGPGAHVIVRRPHAGDRPPESALAEAAVLAMNKSWLKDAETAEVVFTEVRHVRKNSKAGPGEVLYDKVYASVSARRDPELEERLRKSEGSA